jgi:hypothetical protein
MQLNAAVYGITFSNGVGSQTSGTLPSGWKYQAGSAVNNVSNGSGGVVAATYVNTANSEMYVAIQGTQPGLDYLTDLGIAAQIVPQSQIANAASYLSSAMATASSEGYSIAAGGHSLGGMIVNYVGANPQFIGIPILAEDAPNVISSTIVTTPNVLNITESSDIVGNTGQSYANTILINAAPAPGYFGIPGIFTIPTQLGTQGTHSTSLLNTAVISGNPTLAQTQLTPNLAASLSATSIDAPNVTSIELGSQNTKVSDNSAQNAAGSYTETSNTTNSNGNVVVTTNYVSSSGLLVGQDVVTTNATTGAATDTEENGAGAVIYTGTLTNTNGAEAITGSTIGSNGSVTGTTNIQVSSSGVATASLSGAPVPVALNAATVTLASNTTATVDGAGDTIDTGTNGSYQFSGVGDVINNFLISTSDVLLVIGSQDTVNISGSSSTSIDGPDTLNINPANADSLDLLSGPITFNTGTGTPFSPSQLAILNGLNGGLSNATMNSNTDAAYSGSGQNVNITGTNITATGINGGNIQTTSSTQSVVTGAGSTYTLGVSSIMTVNGANNTSDIVGNKATLTQNGGGTVFVMGSNSGSIITGNNLTIYESRNATIAAVYGNNNTIHTIGGPNSLVADDSISKMPTAAAVFAPGGTGNTISYDTFGSGSYGGYGFSEAPPTSGTNIGLIASYDAQLGDQSDAETALSAKLQAHSNIVSPGSTTTDTPEFEGAKWASKTITWSLATTYDPVGAQLSGLISSQYLPLIQQTFHDWSVLSGLQFKQVAASASPDIELGWSTFNPAVTGVLGYTGFRVINGALQSGALISLENPADDALAKDSSGQLAYTGTQTELEQLLLHQIGQALGLADDSDPKSIMYAVLSSKNRFFDATDMAGIQDLYDRASVSSPASTTVASDAKTLSSSSPITVAASLVSSLTPNALSPFASEANQLINAMAVFNPSASPTTYTPVTLASVASSMTLAASGH